ncbi:MAG: aminotransferase class V-fold PLP-dependent enzyme [Nitrososphaerota archaeon]
MGLIEELGLKPIINASGNLTILGGTTLEDEVLEAMREASKVYLDMNELHIKAGQYIAKLIGVEDAYITSGAGAGIVLSVAACIVRNRLDRLGTFPYVEDLRHEVIVQKKHRNFYDYMIEIPGAKIVEVGNEIETTEDDLQNVINENTCAVLYFAFDPLEGVLPLDKVVKIAHSHNLPVIVDAAPELPPKKNLRKFYDTGADLVIFSGGKDISAPNDTGIILGRKELVQICRRLGPHSYEKLDNKTRVYLGRPMKTSKEDIFAVIAAIKRYLTLDEDERLRKWEEKTNYIISELKNNGLKNINKFYPKGFGHPRPAIVPRVEIDPPESLTSEEILVKLQESEPPIYAYEFDGKIYINPQCLRDGEEKIIANRLIEILCRE